MENKYIIANSIDFLNQQPISSEDAQPIFKNITNFPSTLRLQLGARVMYLNNKLFNHGICNGTIGIVTDLDLQNYSVQIAFCVKNGLQHVELRPQTTNFIINGASASRTQFPLQNCFALTIHKTQGLTLPQLSIALDSQIFTHGQAYVALSRATNLNNISITALDKSAFMIDSAVVKEYERLYSKAQISLPI